MPQTGHQTGRESGHINGHAIASSPASRLRDGGEKRTPLFGDAYAPAPETVKVEIKPRYELFIGGKWVEPKPDATTPSTNRDATVREREASASAPNAPLRSRLGSDLYFPTLNPANEHVLSEVAQASEADVDRAVRAAREALPKWQALKPTERAKFLFRIARRVQERSRELAVLETMDSGKPIKESRDVDVPLVAAHFFYHAGWADKLQYVFPGSGNSSGTPTLRVGSYPGNARKHAETPHGVWGYPRPVGVCGQIIPWNFPLLMAAWKIAPALACGNTVVLKPAETTPLTALRLAEIFEEIELPPGVVNIITGDGRTGAALVNHPDVDKIAFTGSTDVGKKIARAVAAGGVARFSEAGAETHASEKRATKPATLGKIKKLTLELGGKSPHIIFDDAAIDQAVEGIISGIYFNQGEVCCAGSRLFVQESVLEQVIQKLELRMSTLRVGDPLDKNTDVGAVNSKMQLATIEKYLKLGREEGAELRVPGWSGRNGDLPLGAEACGVRMGTSTKKENPPPSPLPRGGGFWCRPCFFTNVQPSHTIAREEIFGPVLSVLSFRTPEEAISRANNTPYGLAAGVWTEKGSKIFEIARKLKAGVVWCNTYNKFDPASPFGGFKESGFGREGGMQGLRGYVSI